MSLRRFTVEEAHVIAARRREGIPLPQLVAEFGGSTTSIIRALRLVDAMEPLPVRRLSTEERAEIVARYEAGENIKSLSRHFRVRTDAVSGVLAGVDVELRPGGRRRFTGDDLADVVRWYEAGRSVRQIAAEMGASPITVRRTLERAGITLRTAGRTVWTDDMLAMAIVLHRDGRSQEQIGRALGVSQASVSSRLRGAGVTVPRGRRGADHSRWKGGRALSPEGYVLVIPSDADLPFCRVNSSGYAVEHRLVMGRALGRRLERNESVHHINGDKTDNRLENLQLRQGNHGRGVVLRCRSCGSHDIEAVEIDDG